jgi:hypothetical protein
MPILPFVPANAGTQGKEKEMNWIPAFAGMNGESQ